MKTTKTTTNKVSARTLVLVVFMMLSSVAMFGQTTEVAPEVTIEQTVAADDTVATTTAAAANNATMNMVSWFMGTKQTPNVNSTEATSNSKKQLINSGIAPNRLLIKSFLKKASNYASTVA